MIRKILLTFLLLVCLPAAGQDLREFEKRVTEHTLRNGLKFIIVERHDAPTLALHTYVDVGSVNEQIGITGVAHLFEHLAFKGTKTIGTKNWAAEQAALQKLDQAYDRLAAEKRKGDKADKDKLKRLEEEFKRAQEEASRYADSEEFSRVIEQHGGTHLNATTSADATRYFLSLPSNKLELWFSMESERFLQPVLRDFYKERDVVLEERRLRVESDPFGRLMEEFLAVAYKLHPYRLPTVGFRQDLENLTRQVAERFFLQHYTPQKMTIAIVGDVDPKEAIRLAEIYFERIPAGPETEPVNAAEPEQQGEKRFQVEAESQPILLMGYHKPSINHPDNAAFDAITDILGIGRTSRLYTSLVKEKKIAVATGAFPGFPGLKHNNLFLFYAVPAAGKTNEECEKAILEEIEKLKTEPVPEDQLSAVKRRARASLLRQLESNEGLASLLTFYQAVTGDWRNLFRKLDAINRVTASDLQRLAKQYFQKRNRIVGYLVPAGK